MSTMSAASESASSSVISTPSPHSPPSLPQYHPSAPHPLHPPQPYNPMALAPPAIQSQLPSLLSLQQVHAPVSPVRRTNNSGPPVPCPHLQAGCHGRCPNSAKGKEIFRKNSGKHILAHHENCDCQYKTMMRSMQRGRESDERKDGSSAAAAGTSVADTSSDSASVTGADTDSIEEPQSKRARTSSKSAINPRTITMTMTKWRQFEARMLTLEQRHTQLVTVLETLMQACRSFGVITRETENQLQQRLTEAINSAVTVFEQFDQQPVATQTDSGSDGADLQSSAAGQLIPLLPTLLPATVSPLASSSRSLAPHPTRATGDPTLQSSTSSTSPFVT